MAVEQDCKHVAEILSLNTVYNLVSSANNLIVTPIGGTRVQISLTYNMNKTGPMTLPWGTPLITGRRDEHDLLTFTY